MSKRKERENFFGDFTLPRLCVLAVALPLRQLSLFPVRLTGEHLPYLTLTSLRLRRLPLVGPLPSGICREQASVPLGSDTAAAQMARLTMSGLPSAPFLVSILTS